MCVDWEPRFIYNEAGDTMPVRPLISRSVPVIRVAQHPLDETTPITPRPSAATVVTRQPTESDPDPMDGCYIDLLNRTITSMHVAEGGGVSAGRLTRRCCPLLIVEPAKDTADDVEPQWCLDILADVLCGDGLLGRRRTQSGLVARQYRLEKDMLAR